MAHGHFGRPLDFSNLAFFSAREAGGILDTTRIASVPDPRRPLDHFFSTLPRSGDSGQLLEVADHIVLGAASGRRGIWLIDATALTIGLSPLIIELMQRGIIQHIMLDGSAAVADFQFAFFGHIQETPERSLEKGMADMARETGEWMNLIISDGARRGFGIGHSLGRGILDRRARFEEYSILAAAGGLRVPLTVHTTIGADASHQHPSVDSAMLGKAAYKDFQLLAGKMADLHQGGVAVSLAQNETLGEVFLRALNVSRNLGNEIRNFATLQVAPRLALERETPFARAVEPSGKQFRLNGPPSLMVPLLCAAVLRLLR